MHIAALTAVCAYLAVALRYHVIADANIGAGLAFLSIAALGLPWSSLILFGVRSEARDYAETALAITFALVNLLLHGLLTLRLSNRSRSR